MHDVGAKPRKDFEESRREGFVVEHVAHEVQDVRLFQNESCDLLPMFSYEICEDPEHVCQQLFITVLLVKGSV